MEEPHSHPHPQHPQISIKISLFFSPIRIISLLRKDKIEEKSQVSSYDLINTSQVTVAKLKLQF